MGHVLDPQFPGLQYGANRHEDRVSRAQTCWARAGRSAGAPWVSGYTSNRRPGPRPPTGQGWQHELCAVSSPGGPSCAQVRHGRWQEGEWNCPAEIRPNPAEEVPKGTSRRLWVPIPTSQPLGVNPGHPVSPKLPAWMEALSFPTAEPKSFVPPPPQGGQERGPPALPAGAGQLSSAFTPHLIQHQPVRLGLSAFPGRGGQEGAG